MPKCSDWIHFAELKTKYWRSRMRQDKRQRAESSTSNWTKKLRQHFHVILDFFFLRRKACAASDSNCARLNKKFRKLEHVQVLARMFVVCSTRRLSFHITCALPIQQSTRFCFYWHVLLSIKIYLIVLVLFTVFVLFLFFCFSIWARTFNLFYSKIEPNVFYVLPA